MTNKKENKNKNKNKNKEQKQKQKQTKTKTNKNKNKSENKNKIEYKTKTKTTTTTKRVLCLFSYLSPKVPFYFQFQPLPFQIFLLLFPFSPCPSFPGRSTKISRWKMSTGYPSSCPPLPPLRYCLQQLFLWDYSLFSQFEWKAGHSVVGDSHKLLTLP